MRKDPVSEKTYADAIKLIENSLNIKVRKVALFYISKQDLENLIPFKQKTLLLNYIKGLFSLQNDTIYITDGNEEDLQTFLHETLHSNSIFHYLNSPRWIREGLTKAITEIILKKRGLPIERDYYLQKEKNFWLKKLKTNKKLIIEAYFSKNLIQGINILKKILKTEKNILEITFNEYLQTK
ncbi:MAG: hypothetical protein ACTSRG_13920 [Candidatus Helarchaeota archaeon]